MLNLDRTDVGDADLKELAGMSQLEGLHVAGTHVTSDGLVALSGLTNLVELTLSDNDIDDRATSHLRGLNKLKHLHLGRTRITNAGLEPLKGLTSLTYLNLRDTGATQQGATALVNGNPNLYIAYR